MKTRTVLCDIVMISELFDWIRKGSKNRVFPDITPLKHHLQFWSDDVRVHSMGQGSYFSVAR